MNKLFRRYGQILYGAALLLAGVGASAQLTTATLTGTITHASGAVLPDAMVTITNKSTNYTSKVVANASGFYRAEFLPTGEYSACAGCESHAQMLPVSSPAEVLLLLAGQGERGS